MLRSLSSFLFLLVGLPAFAAAGRPNYNTPTLCQAVDAKLPGRVSYPGSAAYNASQSAYYTGLEREIRPRCVFRPRDASEVQQLVRLVKSSQGNFAIRGGGHILWGGAANVENGLTLDLRSLNSFALSQDKKTVTVGGGTIWSDLYPKLTPYGLAVSGARVPGIAVGGYVLGCGIGFYARSHGWSCDHVRGYEVVLSDGRIVYASASSNRDLWLALKGGSNNFGVVTRFDLETIPQGDMWGGQIMFNYTQSTINLQTKAFSNYMAPQNTDAAAMMALVLVFQNPGQTFTVANALFHMKGVVNPPVYKEFLATPEVLANQLGIATVSDVVKMFGETFPKSVVRSYQLVYSFKHSDASIYTELIRLWETGIKPISSTTGLGIQFLIQPHPISNGTNSLGLPAEVKDFVMATVTAVYPNAADDNSVQPAIRAMVDAQEKLLRTKGLYIPFQYLNYADGSQDPIRSYGKEARERLQQVSKKYDAAAVFQKRVAGKFKLFV